MIWPWPKHTILVLPPTFLPQHKALILRKRGRLSLLVWTLSRRCGCVRAESCLTLCDPVDCSSPGSSDHGILQARIMEWVAISFSRGSCQPRVQALSLVSSALVCRFFTPGPLGKPLGCRINRNNWVHGVKSVMIWNIKWGQLNALWCCCLKENSGKSLGRVRWWITTCLGTLSMRFWSWLHLTRVIVSRII